MRVILERSRVIAVVVTLIVVHAGAALYHHFLLKDSTLMRMLKPGTV